jgi:hypothetical protein
MRSLWNWKAPPASDPVFGDPLEEGAVVSCPKRTVHLEHLPPIDILIVSHRNIPSLARVPRACDAICRPDALIVHALTRLGFERVHPVYPMACIPPSQRSGPFAILAWYLWIKVACSGIRSTAWSL